ncbi:Crp/Fnr family transcriptional regulator [Nitrospira sp.]|nr:Crp/Fnr family transcriptional regulator [Nitrospira sp.]
MFLQGLHQADYRLLNHALTEVHLKRGAVLGGTLDQPDFAYFPIDAVVSLVGTTTDGLGVEIGMVGREGCLALPSLFGRPVTAYQKMVQSAGMTCRLPGQVLRDATQASRTLREHLLRYGSVRVMQLAQSAICHRFHRLEQRLCRWLLSVHDRLERNEIQVTHESLAHLLGGRRPTLNTTIKALRHVGVVEYRRGSVVIKDRKRLESCSCECYRVIASEIREFLGRTVISLTDRCPGPRLH